MKLTFTKGSTACTGQLKVVLNGKNPDVIMTRVRDLLSMVLRELTVSLSLFQTFRANTRDAITFTMNCKDPESRTPELRYVSGGLPKGESVHVIFPKNQRTKGSNYDDVS